MTQAEKCTKRANYVLGYTKPQFTDEERVLMREYNNWSSWTPDMKFFPNDGPPIPFPRPEKPEVTWQFLDKIIKYDEWVKQFNLYYDKL